MFGVSASSASPKRPPMQNTDRGRPSHVLMLYEDYQRVIGQQKNILDLVGMKAAGDICFEPAKIDSLSKPIDLS